MSEALQQSRAGIVTPSIASAGRPTKVLVDETPGLARRDVGLAVAYANGLRFYFKPLPPGALPDYPTLLEDTSAVAPYEDGRDKPFEIITIEGVDVAVREAGTQTSKIDGEIATDALVQWNVDDGTYILRSRKLSASDLVAAARDLIQRGARPSKR